MKVIQFFQYIYKSSTWNLKGSTFFFHMIEKY